MSPKELRRTVAANIRAEARRRDVALTILADRAAVSRTQLFDFLRGRKSTTLDTLAKLADVLGVEPQALLAPREVERATPARRPRAR